jgi:hypothetical protein
VDCAVSEAGVICRQDQSTRNQLIRHVHVRTGRRIKNLVVELEAERIVLRGCADSYYVKQLAQEGVFDLLPEARLHNAIAVSRPETVSVI